MPNPARYKKTADLLKAKIKGSFATFSDQDVKKALKRAGSKNNTKKRRKELEAELQVLGVGANPSMDNKGPYRLFILGTPAAKLINSILRPSKDDDGMLRRVIRSASKIKGMD